LISNVLTIAKSFRVIIENDKHEKYDDVIYLYVFDLESDEGNS